MTLLVYSIKYQYSGDINLKSKAAMKKHLAEEQAAWAGFFEHFNKNEFGLPVIHQKTKTIEAVSNELQILSAAIDKPDRFNQYTSDYGGNLTPPPPSGTIEGQLILQLFAQRKYEQSFAVFLSVYNKNRKFRVNPSANNFEKHSDVGEAILNSVYASKALPADKLLTQKIAAAAKRVNADAEALSEQIDETRTLGANFNDELGRNKSKLKQQVVSFSEVFADSEAVRMQGHSSAENERAEANRASLTDAQNKATLQLEQIQRKASEALNGIEDTHKRYHEQLRYAAPVRLWADRAAAHHRLSQDARNIFWGLIVFAILVAAVIPLCFGDFVAKSFYDEACSAMNAASCKRVFSVKGPLLISGLLFFSSILLWIIRMQYRVFLSERHLSIDASEKEAFAATYLALREDATVSEASEAIVLASLFRPTQDGIVKDDESMVDVSAAAIIAKRMGG